MATMPRVILSHIITLLYVAIFKVTSRISSACALAQLNWLVAPVHMRYLVSNFQNHTDGITQCYLPPGSSDFPFLSQQKLVLDVATPEGCKAEFAWVVVIS